MSLLQGRGRGRGVPGTEAAVKRTGWELGETIDCRFPFLWNHTRALSLGLESQQGVQGRDDEPHTTSPLPEDGPLAYRAAIPKSLEGKMESGQGRGASMSTFSQLPPTFKAAPSSASLHLCPGAFPGIVTLKGTAYVRR